MATTTRRPRGQGRPHASAPGASREALLDSAATLFGRQGIAATTMAQIAAEAGVTAAMVHYHFAGREALLDALVEARIAPLLAFVWTPVPPVPDDTPLPDRIARLVRRLAEGPGRTPWLPPLWIREVLSEGGLLRERILAHLPAGPIQALGAAVAAGQARGEVNPDLEPRLFLLSILGLTMLPLATAGLWGRVTGAPAFEPEAVARHATALLTAGLRPVRRSR